MSVIDFKEIPEAHLPSGEQDSFELFARDFFEYLGYKVAAKPGRGADGGSDLIVLETRKGIGGETHIKWLVSCKHKAHSGKSITPNDEPSILDRVKSKQSQGFIGFYSTLPSSALLQRLEGLQQQIEHQVFDSKTIERYLLVSTEGVHLASQYFPISMKGWKQENPTPVHIFDEGESLRCLYCGADLLAEKKGIVVTIEKLSHYSDEELYNLENNTTSPEPIEILDMYWCCKGNCDRHLRAVHDHIYPGNVDAWTDIPDLMIPTMYLHWLMSLINSLHKKALYHRYIYTDKAVEQLKKALLEIFPYITRELTNDEQEQVKFLLDIPSWLGGLGSS